MAVRPQSVLNRADTGATLSIPLDTWVFRDFLSFVVLWKYRLCGGLYSRLRIPSKWENMVKASKH
jgi:hypothetical protein